MLLTYAHARTPHTRRHATDFDSNAGSVEGHIYLAVLTLARPALKVIYTWPFLPDFGSSAAGVEGHIYLAAFTLAQLVLKVIYAWPFVRDFDSSATSCEGNMLYTWQVVRYY